MQFKRLIGLNFFITEASGSLGIKVRTAKFNLNRSSFPAEKSLNMAIISSLTKSQKCW
jgi:hypothetical protein